jgi:hypothetical protein
VAVQALHGLFDNDIELLYLAVVIRRVVYTDQNGIGESIVSDLPSLAREIGDIFIETT